MDQIRAQPPTVPDDATVPDGRTVPDERTASDEVTVVGDAAAPAPMRHADRRGTDPETWAAVFAVLICVGVGLPVVIDQLRGGDVVAGPAWVWWVGYLGFLALLFIMGAAEETASRRTLRALMILQVALGSAAVLTTARAGWTPILLVFAAALAAHYTSPRLTTLVVVWNSGIVVVSAMMAGAPVIDALFVTGLYVFLQLCSVMGVLGEQRERAARTELAAAHTELRATNVLLAESSRANERLRIARELHDLVGHQLTALALELEVATHQSSPPAAEHVARARKLAKGLLADVRTTVGGLRTTTPELRQALEAVAGDLPDLTVHLDVGDDVQVDESAVTAMVRCVQEIVTNTVKHAGACNLWIELRAERGSTVLAARDDGRGAPQLRAGNGLTGMRERIAELGGTLALSSDDGFQVVARVPST